MSNLIIRQQVVQERSELAAKLDQLKAFIDTAPFRELHGAHQGLLDAQAEAMQLYLRILDERLKEWL